MDVVNYVGFTAILVYALYALLILLAYLRLQVYLPVFSATLVVPVPHFIQIMGCIVIVLTFHVPKRTLLSIIIIGVMSM